jgi:inner membrane protein
MDTITHGIAGALIGKALFSKEKRVVPVATFAAAVGAMFPDIDIVRYGFSSDPLAIVKYHRAITHSFIALPFWAIALALLTHALLPFVKRQFPKLADLESPSLPLLTFIYAIGIASHILLDGMTSFGTRMWTPLSQTRVAWDILFIIDFIFTSLVLVPQIVAWIYSDR